MVRRTMIGYSLITLWRARRRAALVIVGLSLAVAIVATPAVALDSEIQTLVRQLVESIPYDYLAQGFSSEYDNSSATAAGAQGVIGAEPVVISPPGLTFAVGRPTSGAGANLTPINIAFVRASFASFAGRLGFSGSFQLPLGTLAVPDRIAGRYGLGVGDQIQLLNVVNVCSSAASCSMENFTANYTIGTVLTTPLASNTASHLAQPLSFVPGRDVVFAGLDALDQMRTVLNLAIDNPPLLRIFVWADRGQLINPYDAAETQARVLHVEREVTAGLADRGFSVAEGSSPETGLRISDVVRVVDDSMVFQRGVLLLLSLPAIGLALVFTRMSFESGLAKRRHEIGTLRSRGSDVGMVTAGLLVEALSIGAVAALCGLALSVVLSRVFLGFVNASLPGSGSIPLNEISVSLSAIAVTIIAAILAAFLVAYPLVRRASNIRVVLALKVISPFETAVEYQEARSFLLTALGLSSLLLFAGLAGSSGQAGILQFLLGALLAVLIALAPVLLILGVARYVTLGTDRPYRGLARMVRPWLGQLDFLVAEGLRRNPRRSSNLAVLTAFALTFAMFVVSLAAIVDAQTSRVARTIVGGDVRFDSGGITAGDLANLSARPDVRGATVVDFISSNYGVLAAINGSDYARTVTWLDSYYFEEGGPGVVASLASTNGAIPNAAAASALGLRIGDQLVLNVVIGGGRTAHLYAVIVKVVAVVMALPGLQRSGDAIDFNPTIVVDRQTLEASGLTELPLTSPGERLILRTQSAEDPHVVARYLEDRWSGTAIVYQDFLESLRDDPFRAALFGLLYTEAGLAVFVVILAVASAAYASGVEREGELATIVSRGFDRRRLTLLLLGEGSAVGVIGSVLAIPTTLVLLWAFLRTEALIAPYSLPMEFVVPLTTWILLLATLGGIAIGSVLAGLRLRWMNLPKVLKLRGL
ncbi:MAG: FtsX-like permease family protein [Methanobacteriota archaeon]|nr:MAG: FtsX-like permease family protein [Euryarchaeota archaeon]